MEDTQWTRLAEQKDVVKKVDWTTAPEGAEFYAYGEFRKQWCMDGDWHEAYWDTRATKWVTTIYVPLQRQRYDHPDFEVAPPVAPVYDESLDDKQDSGEIGREGEFVEFSKESEALSRLKEQAAKFAPNGDIFMELIPADEPKPIKSDGGSSSYYDIPIPDWLFDKIYERRYTENCYIKTEELIEVLGSDFDEGNILKCLVRINSLKKGKGKAGKDEEFVKVSEEQKILDKLLENARRIHNPPKTSIQFLDEVKYIQSERAAEYEQEGGERSFAKIATVFNTYTGKHLQPSDIALILEILKNVRFYSQDGYHRDSVVDKISYGSLWAELVTEERE